jgi:hypothetical protein
MACLSPACALESVNIISVEYINGKMIFNLLVWSWLSTIFSYVHAICLLICFLAFGRSELMCTFETFLTTSYKYLEYRFGWRLHHDSMATSSYIYFIRSHCYCRIINVMALWWPLQEGPCSRCRSKLLGGAQTLLSTPMGHWIEGDHTITASLSTKMHLGYTRLIYYFDIHWELWFQYRF